MEIEYKDESRRGRYIIIAGIVLAVVAGASAFYAINQAQQQAGQGALQHVTVVVAARDIPARKPVEAVDVELRDVPLDPTNERGILTSTDLVIGRVLAVTLLQGQLVTTNLLASSAAGGQFSILDPLSSFSPDSEPWRAMAITVPDDRAVGGMVQPNATVDVIVTALINVPQEILERGRYYTDKSTKVVYQDMVILAKTGQTYIIRAPLRIAEELSHLQTSGTAIFTMVLRPDVDTRIVDAADLGATTNRIITKYGLPLPETYPAGGPVPQRTGTPSASPAPSATPGS